ncbi:MAG: hypothetical protein JSR39_03720 [Verrucomicrobia bacterium]|nr:hypothetical protein [Verrucomicrobiota bacterium]
MPFFAGTVYPESEIGECLTKKMLALSATFPKKITREGRFELGSDRLFRHRRKMIFFEGQINNFSELVKRLEAERISLASSAPEEIIGCLYDLYKEEFPLYLDGSFAIALLDIERHELLLFRDRIGEQPLYWCLHQNTFVFANSLKIILNSDLISRSPDLEAFSYYMAFGFIPQEKTLVRGVFKLQPGHYLRYTRDNNLFIRPYWAYNAFIQKKNLCARKEELEELIRLSWKSRLSSAHSPVLVSDLNEPEATLPQELEDSSLTVHADHTDCFKPSEVLAQLPEMIWALDEPIADLNFPARYLLCQSLKKQQKTDLFFLTGSLQWLYQEIQPPQLSKSLIYDRLNRSLKKHLIIPLLSKIHLKSAYAMLRSANTHPWHKAFLNQSALFTSDEFEDLHSTLLKPINPEIFLHRFPALEKLGPTLGSLLYLYFKTKLPSDVLPTEVRLCAHFGLKRHAPYLNHTIIEWIASLPETPSHFSLNDLLLKGRKPLQKRIVPSLPHWAQTMEYRQLTDQLKSSILVDAGILSAAWLSEQMKNFTRHPHLFFQELWGILVLETWFRLYFEQTAQV